ncbi:MAG: helix-turn-helix transcriptional regulator [Rhizobacter sp.]|nr:helix-turn-helix transcriptional regulator [Ferruginibacter sp.]
MDSALKSYRILHNLGQSAMAELLGVSLSTISMVENGHRQLPGAAGQRFMALRQEERNMEEGNTANTDISLERLQTSHMYESAQYLLSYKKDCEFALHKYEKQVRDWKNKYQKAIPQYILARDTIKGVQQNIADAYLAAEEKEKIVAADTVIQIARQKPEIVMVKIEGLKQQIRTIKAMLGKKKSHLGMKAMESITFPLLLPENKDDNKTRPLLTEAERENLSPRELSSDPDA